MELVLIENNILYNYKIEFNKTKIENFKNVLIGCSEVKTEIFYDDSIHPEANLKLANNQVCDSHTDIVFHKHDNGFSAEIATYPVLYHVLFGKYKSYNKPLESVYLWLTNQMGIKKNKDDLLESSNSNYIYDSHITDSKRIWLCRNLFEVLDITLIEATPMEKITPYVNAIGDSFERLPKYFNPGHFFQDLENKMNEALKNGKMFHEIANKLNIYINEEGKMSIENTMAKPLLEKNLSI